MKRYWALAVVLTFFPSLVSGQPSVNDKLTRTETAANTHTPATFYNAASVEAVPVAPSRLVIPPQAERAANKKFWLVNAYQLIWTVADIETTAANLSSNSHCREMNPLVGSRPSRTVLYLSNLPVMVGSGYLAYRSRKHQGKFWYLMPSLAGSAHAAGTIWNVTGSSC